VAFINLRKRNVNDKKKDKEMVITNGSVLEGMPFKF
jgi:hypothetical protein